jgi:hypothetical protein
MTCNNYVISQEREAATMAGVQLLDFNLRTQSETPTIRILGQLAEKIRNCASTVDPPDVPVLARTLLRTLPFRTWVEVASGITPASLLDYCPQITS